MKSRGGGDVAADQTDDEKFLGLVPSAPVTPTIGELATAQCGFCTFLALPVFMLWGGLVSSDKYARALSVKVGFWRAIGASAPSWGGRGRSSVVVTVCVTRTQTDGAGVVALLW